MAPKKKREKKRGNLSESLQRITRHWDSNFRVRLRANAVDPEVMSETVETIVVSGFHLQIKNYKTQLKKQKNETNKTLPSIHDQQRMPPPSISAPT